MARIWYLILITRGLYTFYPLSDSGARMVFNSYDIKSLRFKFGMPFVQPFYEMKLKTSKFEPTLPNSRHLQHRHFNS